MRRKRPNATNKTLCWSCRNAIPGSCYGCSWSRYFEPVKGWTADQKIQVISHGAGKSHSVVSYYIHKCPEFIKD